MKKLTLYCVIFLFCLSGIPTAANSQSKYALIFAAGKYKAWPEISSINDVPWIRSALESQGFPESNITVLTNEAVTIEGIRNAFRTLIGKVAPGDVVVIHFSAHGEQVADDNQDETDGLDETIVTWDAAFPVNRDHFDKDQAAYFRDDEFGKFMDQLRGKLGGKGDLLVILDACHSGSGTRGEHKTRGGQPPLVPNNFKAPAAVATDQPDVFMDKNAGTGSLSSYIIISGAQAAELNSEMTDTAGISMGSLTYAVSQALEQLKPGTTYRSLFADVISAMNRVVPDQHPVLEGNGTDRELFGGRFVEQKSYANITAIDGTGYTLDQGQLAGIVPGSGVALYPRGTTDPDKAQAMATGTVHSSAAYQSVVVWDKDPGLLVTSDCWVFVTKPVYKIPPVVLAVSQRTTPAFSDAENKQVQKEIAGMPMVKTTGAAELLLKKGLTEDSLFIAGNGSLFDTLHTAMEGSLAGLLKRYVQYKFLQQLSITDPLCPMQVSLIPVVNGKPAPELAGKYIHNGLMEFKEGDSLMIYAKNNGQSALYLNILDMQPDGRINPIFPNSNIQPAVDKSNLMIGAGQEHTFSNNPIRIWPPFGLETFKIFISPTEIDMESIAQTAGAQQRSDLGGLQKLFSDSYGIATRGESKTAKASGSAFNIVFRIKPR